MGVAGRFKEISASFRGVPWVFSEFHNRSRSAPGGSMNLPEDFKGFQECSNGSLGNSGAIQELSRGFSSVAWSFNEFNTFNNSARVEWSKLS